MWIHTALLRPNLLVDGGRLYAVIDFGGIGVGEEEITFESEDGTISALDSAHEIVSAYHKVFEQSAGAV